MRKYLQNAFSSFNEVSEIKKIKTKSFLVLRSQDCFGENIRKKVINFKVNMLRYNNFCYQITEATLFNTIFLFENKLPNTKEIPTKCFQTQEN